MSSEELSEIRRRYGRRLRFEQSEPYAWSRPDVLYMHLQLDEKIMKLLGRAGLHGFRDLTLLEIGCGTGQNLFRFLRWGFRPENLAANELREEPFREARSRLPAKVNLIPGDACKLDLPAFDIVYQSTVFSSILDGGTQAELADNMWRLLKPGGVILWYDLAIDNPRNRDVTGLPRARIRELFPLGDWTGYRTTLAPPLGRRVATWKSLYLLLDAFPLLRTHWLATLQKRN